jgi:hypothetical protein
MCADGPSSCRCKAQFCYVCGREWHTCDCEQWDEQRLLIRAAQVVDRNPRHRLWQPEQRLHVQPARRRLTAASNFAVVAGPATAPGAHRINWPPVDSDSSDEEPDLGVGESLQQPGNVRQRRIAEAAEHLRANHDCVHERWRWVKGGHRCEECHNFLREYIFECRQCQLQACNRCRRNRL